MFDKLIGFVKGEKYERQPSIFDAGILEFAGKFIIACLIMVFTLGIGTPWAYTILINFMANHTVINNRRLEFTGTGTDLFVELIKWLGLILVASVITIVLACVIHPIFLIFEFAVCFVEIFILPVRIIQWIVCHIRFEDEVEVIEE